MQVHLKVAGGVFMLYYEWLSSQKDLILWDRSYLIQPGMEIADILFLEEKRQYLHLLRNGSYYFFEFVTAMITIIY